MSKKPAFLAICALLAFTLGNAALAVDNGPNRETSTDVSAQTVTTSGNTAAFDTNGLASISFLVNVTAISGSGAYIQVHLQTSEDATNWESLVDTTRRTATGVVRTSAVRSNARYYRYAWDVAGTTPSVTFTVTTTLKNYLPGRRSVRYLYADLDLQVNGNASTTFNAEGCNNVAMAFSRGADGGNNGTVQMFASLDAATWFSVSGNLAANVSANNDFSLAGQAWLYYQVQVTAHTSVGTRVLDIQWSCD